MIIIVGLGNPEERYGRTPHNIGFEALDLIAKSEGLRFKEEDKLKSLIAKNRKLILIKPNTYMNRSGEAVRAVSSYYKTKDILVIHDDIDLLIGQVKISENRGSAGHKGVESIMTALKTKNFKRIRIGVSKPKKATDASRYVLKKLSLKDHRVIMDQIAAILDREYGIRI